MASLETVGYLLDTHVLLWWLSDPAKLDEHARSVIADGSSRVLFSAAGAWEMAIKKALGRLDFPSNLSEVLQRDRIEVLPISLEHALGVGELPMHHTDPFDRLMISQALREGLTLVTRDPAMEEYGVEVVGA
ncbi:MAG: type II toxin-antitoxin system VapC family toxin [Planctomycetota bacterium]